MTTKRLRSKGALLLGVLALGCDSGTETPSGQPLATSAGAGGMPSGTAGAAGASGAAGSSGGSSSGLSGGGGGGASTAGSAAVAGAAGNGGAAGSGGAGEAAGAAGAPAQLSDFQLFGRWDVREVGKAITVNSGSHVTAKFNGTGISAKFDTSGNKGAIPTVSYRIDGGELVEKEIAASLTLASSLPAGDHELLLFVRGMNEFDARWTPPLVASTVFQGFAVDAGKLVPTARTLRKKVEFLGDSITEGVAVHDKGPANQSTPNWRCDGARNYAALTAQKLGVEWRQVGFGSQGLSKGGSGGVPKAQDAFNWFYAGAPRDDWQADIVVINQGTNDRAQSGAAFAPLYADFLGIVRKGYPNAKIVALRPLVGAFGTEIEAQVKARKGGGDEKVFYVDTAGWTEAGDFTDGVHPNQAGSVKIADKLAAAIEALP